MSINRQMPEEFDTKTRFRTHVMSIKDELFSSNNKKTVVIEKDHDDWNFFVAVLKHHHRYTNTDEDNYDRFEIQGARSGGCKLVVFTRGDSEGDEVSVKKLELIPPVERPVSKNKFDGAMRQLVKEQRDAWAKQNEGNKMCTKCGADESLEVDHNKPLFHEIVKEFIKIWEADDKKAPTAVDVRDEKRNTVLLFNPGHEKFEAAFKYFHDQKADFQWLCGTCNKTKRKSSKSEEDGTRNELDDDEE